MFQAIEYEVGDVVEILPSQNPDAVDAFLSRCNLEPEAFIKVCKLTYALMFPSFCKENYFLNLIMILHLKVFYTSRNLALTLWSLY